MNANIVVSVVTCFLLLLLLLLLHGSASAFYFRSEDLADFPSGYALTLHQSLHFRVRGVAVVPAILACDIMAHTIAMCMARHRHAANVRITYVRARTAHLAIDRPIRPKQSKPIVQTAFIIEACRLLSCFGGWQLPAPAVEFAAHPRQFRYSPANPTGHPPP